MTRTVLNMGSKIPPSLAAGNGCLGHGPVVMSVVEDTFPTFPHLIESESAMLQMLRNWSTGAKYRTSKMGPLEKEDSIFTQKEYVTLHNSIKEYVTLHNIVFVGSDPLTKSWADWDSFSSVYVLSCVACLLLFLQGSRSFHGNISIQPNHQIHCMSLMIQTLEAFQFTAGQFCKDL